MKFALNEDGKLFEGGSTYYSKVDNDLIEKAIRGMSEKEKLMKAKSLILMEKSTGRLIFELNMIQNQHFYPLSILDYANAMKKLMKKQISNLPIMSLDSHDYNFCDFNCKDCLAVDTREWAKDNLGFVNFDVVQYEKVLKEIARYSKQRGCESVRFEMSGEGNPDMYKDRARIIKFAATECNMKPVYISSGSMLNDETIDALAKYAYYIRISLPGLNEKSYEIYSNQKKSKKFTFADAEALIEKLVKKRKEYGREDKLMIGARTCMRPENEGSYLSVAKSLAKIGLDSFQVVKILVPMGEDITKYKISENVKNEILELKANYKQFGLLHVQVPDKLDYVYYDRQIDDNKKPSQCFSSFVSPILYGPNLVVCTHWEKIKDIENSHYGNLKGAENELEDTMCGEKAVRIRKQIPERCSSCCSIFDNQVIEIIRAQLSIVNDLDNVEFMLTY